MPLERPPLAALLDPAPSLMDGYELAQQLLAQCSRRPPLLVAATGRRQRSDRERTRAAGVLERLLAATPSR